MMNGTIHWQNLEICYQLTCYPISITTTPSDTVLNLNLVKFCTQYSINATNNTTPKILTYIEQSTIAKLLKSTTD